MGLLVDYKISATMIVDTNMHWQCMQLTEASIGQILGNNGGFDQENKFSQHPRDCPKESIDGPGDTSQRGDKPSSFWSAHHVAASSETRHPSGCRIVIAAISTTYKRWSLDSWVTMPSLQMMVRINVSTSECWNVAFQLVEWNFGIIHFSHL